MNDTSITQQGTLGHAPSQTSPGPQAGAADSRQQRTQRRDEWKRRQQLQPSPGTRLTPTLPERINRLRPSERHELHAIVKSLKLRKIIRRTLAEAYWSGAPHMPLPRPSDSMQRLRATVKSHESLMEYERSLTPSSTAQIIAPTW